MTVITMPKCKYMKQVKFQGIAYCAFKSTRAEIHSQYIGITKKFDLAVMGSQNHPSKTGNWWGLCVGGKGNTGKTPSKYTYYT